jgi:Butirosin biosynthesis protein H, N-terminal
MRVSAKNLNCYLHCIKELLRFHNREDILETIVQPLGFGFEVELTSREWWIGGHAECDFYNLTFQNGFEVWWEELDPKEFINFIKKEISNNRPIIFQTEWSKVPYHPHYQLKLFDLHTILILDYNEKSQEIKVMDRMVTDPEMNFDLRKCGWVSVSNFLEAIIDKLLVVKYEFHENSNDEGVITQLFEDSVKNMKDKLRKSSPQLHIAYGLDGMNILKETFRHFNPNFRRDNQQLFLVGERLPNCINNHIIGNRLLLAKYLKVSKVEEINELHQLIYESVTFWEIFRDEAINIREYNSVNYNGIIDSINKCINIENQIVNLMKKYLSREAV